MEKVTDWYFAIVFFSGVLGFVVACILFFVHRNESFAARLLAGFLVCFSWLAINFALMNTSFYLHAPHLWRAFGWTSYCYAPLGYIYVRSMLEQSYRFKKWDFLWFLPALLYTVNLLPFYILPAANKIAFLETIVADPKIITRETEGLLPIGWGVWGRVLIGIVASVAQFVVLSKWKNRILQTKDNRQQNSALFNWLYVFSLSQACFYGIVFIEFAFHFLGYGNYNYVVVFTISATILFVCISLLVRPTILYGFRGWLQTPDLILSNAKTTIEPESIKRNTLSIEQGNLYKSSLENHFRSNLPFKKPGYTISDLSAELEIPIYQLSAFINQEYGKNFNELINECRIDHLETVLRNNPEYANFTLEALGREVGFNTRAAFIAAVKKKTGRTPSAYFERKSLKITG